MYVLLSLVTCTAMGLGYVDETGCDSQEQVILIPPYHLSVYDFWYVSPDRECIIPDISRTYHFGSSGLNMNPYFQDHYFAKHTLNTNSDVQLKAVQRYAVYMHSLAHSHFAVPPLCSMKKEEYELIIHSLFRYVELGCPLSLLVTISLFYPGKPVF